RDTAAAARAAAANSPMVVDLFAGSGNTLHWIKRQTRARRAIGMELDEVVFELTRTNLSIIGLNIDLRHDSYEHGLQTLADPDADLVIVFVAPPWGRALGEKSGLDLRRTQPPVSEIIDITTGILGSHRLLFAVQVHETVDAGSLAELTA